MAQRTAPALERLAQQFEGIINTYRRMLDDEFLFASAAQVPQAAVILDAASGRGLSFEGHRMNLADVLALIAYRYGFTGIEPMGQGGYAIVVGHHPDSEAEALMSVDREVRRVMRLVPDHHVRDVMGGGDYLRPFDVRLDADNEPIRDPDYPLLLSDVFLLPRHTTRLVFYDEAGHVIQASGRPAILHCQVLPEVVPMNASGLNRQMAETAGELLEAALATLGVSVADAHGGNGGVLVGRNGKPLTFEMHGEMHYIPVVLDYGYYAEIGPRTLASVLIRRGLDGERLSAWLEALAVTEAERRSMREMLMDDDSPLERRLGAMISALPVTRAEVGRLLLMVDPPVLRPDIWIERSEQQWRTTKEKNYPPLEDQARLNTIYPAYDEILFPQRIEEYRLTVMG